VKEKLTALLRSPRLWELVRYGAAGVATTAVNFVVFGLLYDILGWNESVANTVSVILSILFAYVVNKLFVFRSHCPDTKALVKEAIGFFSARGITMLLEVGGMVLFGTVLQWNAWLVKIGLNVLVLVLNYVFSKLLVFRKK